MSLNTFVSSVVRPFISASNDKCHFISLFSIMYALEYLCIQWCMSFHISVFNDVYSCRSLVSVMYVHECILFQWCMPLPLYFPSISLFLIIYACISLFPMISVLAYLCFQWYFALAYLCHASLNTFVSSVVRLFVFISVCFNEYGLHISVFNHNYMSLHTSLSNVLSPLYLFSIIFYCISLFSIVYTLAYLCFQ